VTNLEWDYGGALIGLLPDLVWLHEGEQSKIRIVVLTSSRSRLTGTVISHAILQLERTIRLTDGIMNLKFNLSCQYSMKAHVPGIRNSHIASGKTKDSIVGALQRQTPSADA